MTDLILESADIAEIGGPDVGEDFSDLTATKSADHKTMDFHIQMRGYTMCDFETMVIAAAAQQILSGRTFKKEIEEVAISAANERLNAQIQASMKDVMGITVTSRGKEALTLGQMIGMEAKDYLTQPVNRSGEVDSSGWGTDRTPRIAWLVGDYVRKHFAKEINGAMSEMITEIREAIRKQLDTAISAERERVIASLLVEAKKPR